MPSFGYPHPWTYNQAMNPAQMMMSVPWGVPTTSTFFNNPSLTPMSNYVFPVVPPSNYPRVEEIEERVSNQCQNAFLKYKAEENMFNKALEGMSGGTKK